MNYGKMIKTYLKRKNMTQAQLSRLSGVPTSTLNDLVNNKTNISKKTKQKLFSILEIDENDLIRNIQWAQMQSILKEMEDESIVLDSIQFKNDLKFKIYVTSLYVYDNEDIVLYLYNGKYYSDYYKYCKNYEIIGVINSISLL